MRKVIDTVLGIIGAISAILSVAEVFPTYKNAFLVITGIAVYHLLFNRFEPNNNQQNSSHTPNKANQIIMLIAAPFVIVIVLIVILKWLDLMSPELLHGILASGAFLLVFIYAIEFGAYCSSSTDSKDN